MFNGQDELVSIGDIVEAIRAGRLSYDEIFDSAARGEVIEDYPDDRPYPSCLVLGTSSSGSPIHSVWGYNKVSGWTVLITVYRPDPDRWIDWRKRREKP